MKCLVRFSDWKMLPGGEGWSSLTMTVGELKAVLNDIPLQPEKAKDRILEAANNMIRLFQQTT